MTRERLLPCDRLAYVLLVLISATVIRADDLAVDDSGRAHPEHRNEFRREARHRPEAQRDRFLHHLEERIEQTHRRIRSLEEDIDSEDEHPDAREWAEELHRQQRHLEMLMERRRSLSRETEAPEHRPDAEHRIRHLHEAARHLAEAGLHGEAERFERQAREWTARMHERGGPEHHPHPAPDEHLRHAIGEAIAGPMREMHEDLRDLQQGMRDLHRRMEDLEERGKR